MPLKVQRPDAAVSLSAEFGTLGKLQLALDEIIVPVANVADLVEDPWVDFAIGTKIAQSGAGNNWKFQLINPDYSRNAVRLGFMEWSLSGIASGLEGVAAQIDEGAEISASGLGLGFKTSWLDFPTPTFDPNERRSVAIVRTLASAGLISGNQIAHVEGLARTPIRIDTPVVLAPGTYFLAEQQALNVAGGLRFEWSERPLSPEELRGLGLSPEP